MSPPLEYAPQKVEGFKSSSEIHLQDMLDFFIRYMNFDNLGKIANSHLALADQSPTLAFDEKCLRLAELHSDAVDFVKTGYCIERIDPKLLAKEWPDFMEKKDYLIIYESVTVLGELYREVKAIIKGKKEEGEISNERSELNENYKIDMDLVYKDWEEHLNSAFDMLEDFQFEMHGLMNLFSIRNEFEVYSGNFSKFTKSERKGKVNVEILQKRVLDNIVVLKKKFELVFYENMKKNEEKEKSKASAVYLVSYLNKTHQKKEGYEIFNAVFESKRFKRNEKRMEENEMERVIGLPWLIVSDLLIKIKNEKHKKEFKEKKKEKKEENKEKKEKEIIEKEEYENEDDEYLDNKA